MNPTKKISKAKQWLGYYETICGSHACTYDTIEEVIKIKQANDQNLQSGATVDIYTKIPYCSMSISKAQAKELYQFLHGKTVLPNLLYTLLDEIVYYYPDITKEK